MHGFKDYKKKQMIIWKMWREKSMNWELGIRNSVVYYK